MSGSEAAPTHDRPERPIDGSLITDLRIANRYLAAHERPGGSVRSVWAAMREIDRQASELAAVTADLDAARTAAEQWRSSWADEWRIPPEQIRASYPLPWEQS